MEFDDGTKKDLKELILLRMNKDIDEEYLHLLTEIVNSSSIFNGKVVTRYSPKTAILAADYKKGDITYNIEGFRGHLSKLYRYHKSYFAGDLKQFSGYWFSFCYLHELSHIYQLLCANDSISEYTDLNNLYRDVFDACNNFRNVDRKIYLILHDKYFYERYANIVAGNFLVDVFGDTEFDYYAKLNNINKLLSNGYSLKRNKVISPIERTFKYLRIKNNFEEVNLPFKVLFEHGFKISTDDFHYIHDEVLKAKGSVDYDEVVGRVKTLIKRDDNF